MKDVFRNLAVLAVAAACGCATENEGKVAAQPEAKPAAAVAAKPAPKPTPQQEFEAACKEATKGLCYNHDVGNALAEKLLRQGPYSTNGVFKAQVYRRIFDSCKLPFEWTARWSFKQDLVDELRARICAEVIDDPVLTSEQRRPFVFECALSLENEERFDEAENILKRQIEADEQALSKADPKNVWMRRRMREDWFKLGDVYRLQDRREDWAKCIGKAIAWDPLDSVKFATKPGLELGMKDAVDKWWKDLDNPVEEMFFFVSNDLPRSFRDKARCEKFAADFVTCPTNEFRARCNAYGRYFAQRLDPLGDRMRAALAATKAEDLKPYMLEAARNVIAAEIDWALGCGNWAHAVKLREQFAHLPGLCEKPACNRAHFTALALCGRKQDALKFLAESKEGKHGPVPKKGEKGYSAYADLQYDVYAAVLEGKDALPMIESAADLTRREKCDLTLSAARLALEFVDSAAAERYAAKYETCFDRPEPRTLTVKWFDRPVANVTDWRAVEPQLEKQVCDRPLGGSFAFLETDVASKRKAIERTENETKGARMELSALADRDGLHVFLSVKDENARLVETGEAGGIGAEMYFAPGADQPYTCMMSGPLTGVDTIYNTSYTSPVHQRFDLKSVKPHTFKSEMGYSDDDYVMHLFFPWDDFYQKLPKAGTDWKFEVISWTPAGALTWGGSKGVHAPSHWGNLRFALTADQVRAIKRGILFRAKRGWDFRPDASGGMNAFQYWEDPVLGDPDFHNAKLKPLQKELSGFVARIKKDMTAADVDDVYDRALVRIKGLKHEIDRLRKAHLAEKMVE